VNFLKRRKILVCLICAASFIFAGREVRSERPEYHGLSLAYPKDSVLPTIDQAMPFLMGERIFQMNLEITDKGVIKSALPAQKEDSVLAQYVSSSLIKIHFEVTLKSDKPVSSILPVIVTINPRFRTTDMIFPVNAFTEIKSRSLYFQALEKNGIVLPRLRKFPSYFCDLKMSDSLKYLPFALIKIDLDSSGEVNSTEPVSTSLPAFTRQIESAVLWADFDPLELNGKPAACACYLILSFLPQLIYPTETIEFKADATAAWFDHWRIQLIPDTVGLMLPPLPQKQGIDELSVPGRPKSFGGEVIAVLTVDTLGAIFVNSTDSKDAKPHRAIIAALKSAKFFPATDYSGHPVFFDGSAKFTFSNSDIVRVEYFWLK